MEQKKGFKIVLLMCLGIFLCMIDTTIMNIALPAIQSDLNTSLEKMSWILNVYTMSIAVFAIPLGRIADIFGKAKIYIIGLFIFGLGSMLCAFANSGELLILFRFIQSIGAAILFPTAMVIGVSAVPLAKRNKALTILGVTQGLSAAIGPAVGGVITEQLGWRWVFLVNVPISIVAIVLCFIMLNIKHEERVQAKIDWIGLVLCSSTIFSLTLILVKGNDWGWLSSIAWICYGISIISLILFITVERKVLEPMVNLKLFKDRIFVGASFAVVLSNMFLVGVTVLLPTFLTRLQNKTELEAAFLVTPISGMIFIVSPLAPLLLKRFGKVAVIFAGFLIMSMSYYWLQTIGVYSTNKEIIIPCMLLGIGYGLVVGPITILAASSFEGEMLTASQSVVSMLRQFGIVLAVAVFVSSLTHNISINTDKVYKYAEERAQKIQVEKEEQRKILEIAKTKIESKSVKQGDQKEPQRDDTILNQEEKSKLIEQKVIETLNTIPVQYQEVKKEEITKQVTQEVENKMDIMKEQVNAFSDDVNRYTENKMAESFTDLYKISAPIILILGFISFLFYERKRKHEINNS
ncbi:Drug resistance transporter, EmrB/QacA [Bacillus cereus]|uniref:MFS transporter n=1 Tax=Bacillus wiedmannii TaxID=1890302 RepID=UPI00065BE7C8|nr:MDR family MFS transporter [Bacillus wiedmannii]KMP72626.1 MFS transporter [Bacillus cereus]MCQ6546773.1 DHA2 family efflux MFS transporter permease subunit [Bacillus wiedmannii]MCQ6574564.1 DHA2 family efflux MFS transporter permease subunit [Bacillus wiedmannii]WMS85241.1 DHA2 family efflux MFS transporter permease subunit [Bacillus wiedmannii]SCC38106.1 Drug resistance transporter, EmrB/QacA [Bacillus cereus]